MSPEPGEEVEACCARKFVEGAVAYAAKLGFRPYSGYKMACRVLGGISALDCDRTFTYGQEE